MLQLIKIKGSSGMVNLARSLRQGEAHFVGCPPLGTSVAEALLGAVRGRGRLCALCYACYDD